MSTIDTLSRVKWTDPRTGQLHYGHPHRDTMEAREKGKIRDDQWYVADVILPELFVVNESDLTKVEYDTNARFEEDEVNKFIAEASKKATELSDSLPAEVVKGKLFYISVADGYAWYVVTRVWRKTCRIEWRGFGADRYTDHWFGWGGKFEISKVLPYIQRCQALKEFFS